MKSRMLVISIIAGFVVLSCSPQQIYRDVVDETADQLAEEITARVVNAYLGEIGPRFIQSYTVGLMQVMFYQGGFYGEELDYEPGEYTIWASDDSPYGERFERAFLQRRDDGWEWWRVEIYGEDPDTDEDVHMIMEALFEPRDEQRYIRELHVQYPHEDQPQEVEITEEDAEQWVLQAEEWDQEEFTQAFVATEEVTVPAGTFSADRYRSDAGEQDDVLSEWWITDREVPGSIVKIRQTDEDTGEEFQTMVLQSYGTDAVEPRLSTF